MTFSVFSSSGNRHSLYSVISRWRSLYVLWINWLLWCEAASRRPFSKSVCFLTWAPVSQVWTLRLCAKFLERIAAPPQEGWTPSLFNRSGLPQKLVQLSIKPMLFCRHHLDIQSFNDDSLLWISSLQGNRAYYSVWHRTCKFTHLFNIIFSDLRLAKSNIISVGVDNNLTEFTCSISQHF